MKIRLIISTVFLISINAIFGQTKKIQVIEIANIDYYYVYKVVEYEKTPTDTIIVLGNKPNNKDNKEILLKKGKKYEVETRLKSAIKISDERYMFCKPTQNVFNNVVISNKKSLPILILNYKEILLENKKCKRNCSHK
ncbi:hypothetical protein [Flavobacterium sp.]|uniref:hypothetical protein n=1 Tax=Flavobacterium sp. TaxID=239 RepID=UPI003752442C